MGILERIKDIELELSRTQKNKATTTHIGMLKGQVKMLHDCMRIYAVPFSRTIIIRLE
jgi:ribosome-interacting GTPase 1